MKCEWAPLPLHSPDTDTHVHPTGMKEQLYSTVERKAWENSDQIQGVHMLWRRDKKIKRPYCTKEPRRCQDVWSWKLWMWLKVFFVLSDFVTAWWKVCSCVYRETLCLQQMLKPQGVWRRGTWERACVRAQWQLAEEARHVFGHMGHGVRLASQFLEVKVRTLSTKMCNHQFLQPKDEDASELRNSISFWALCISGSRLVRVRELCRSRRKL